MDVRVLGQVAIVVDGRPAPLGGRRQRAVLAGLVVHGPDGVSTNALIDLVWGEDPPTTARKSVQTYVARLRRLLGPDAITPRSDGYAWAVPPDQLDATRFEEMVREARSRTDPARTWAGLGEALALWRGEPFSDLPVEGTLAVYAQRLRESRPEAVELRAAGGTASGRHAEVIADLQAMVRAEPLREGLWELDRR